MNHSAIDPRRVLIALWIAALTMGSLALPASAASDGKVYMVHGIPGRAIDVCFGPTEVRSGFRFGGQFAVTLPPGQYRVRAFLADQRTCRGTRIIDGGLFVEADGNMTGVMSVSGSITRLTVFLNTLTVPTADDAVVTFRHAARAPRLDVYVAKEVQPAAPTFQDLGRHQQTEAVDLPGGEYAYWLTEANRSKALIGPRTRTFRAGRAYQVHAVGTTAANYRFVVIGQPATVEIPG